ncbi:MAG TPA: hypothetical protein VGE97_03675 [Nitrososphaera sp.]|jgi:hypothetical protein
MIIALTGRRGCGKSTAAAYLVKEHGFELRGFADPLKRSFAALFNIPYHSIEKWKNDPDMFASLQTHTELVADMSFREALQRYGTEAHRDIFGEDFWVDQTLPLPPVGFYAGRKIVIHDCRFINEAYRVKQLSGLTIGITRATNIKTLHRVPEESHVSETEMDDIPKDYVIKNDGTVRELHQSIESLLSAIDNIPRYERIS